VVTDNLSDFPMRDVKSEARPTNDAGMACLLGRESQVRPAEGAPQKPAFCWTEHFDPVRDSLAFVDLARSRTPSNARPPSGSPPNASRGIITRARFLARMPAAPPRPIGTPQGAVPPDARARPRPRRFRR
jgi:hypothetical protein